MGERWDDDEDEFGPDSPDYDLSEAHGYAWEPAREHWPVHPLLLVAVSLLVVLALVLPSLLIFWQYR